VTVRDEQQARALFQQRYGNRPSLTARRIEHHRLLTAAGFRDVTELDVTAAFAATAAARLAETEPHTEELARLEPPGAFAQRQADRRRMLAAIHAGLLRRVLLLARTDKGRGRR
jgi:hypothetical protein